MRQMFGAIHHGKLKNGLQVIINPDNTVPKVSVQLWYAVGSKDERSGQKGLAHLLEHMIFKGTRKLSESDINFITNKFSGYANAFTSYDYTAYVFDFPKQYWTVALDLLADCMGNCRFDENMLQSELKAVIQELKLYKDDFGTSLVEAMVSNMFADHPYHYPIIGYKQDLWSIDRKGLVDFYKQHYVPSNGTLVVVGDIEPHIALKAIEGYFDSIVTSDVLEKKKYYASQDVCSTAVSLYRDVQRPLLLYAWKVPGLKSEMEFVLRVVAYVLGESKCSLFYRLLVDELQLATDVHAYFDDMFDVGVLFLHIDPVDTDSVQEIRREVDTVLASLYQNGIDDDQISQAVKQVHTEYLLQLEEFQERAYSIGKAFLATGNPQYINTYIKDDLLMLKQQVADCIKNYIRGTIMHQGLVLPLPDDEKDCWVALQEESDEMDAVILSRKVRQIDVEPGRYVHKIDVKEPELFTFPAYREFLLSNDLPVIFSDINKGDKVEVLIDFDMQSGSYDPNTLPGLGNFVFAMLQEGTKKYNKAALMQALADKGMHCEVSLGLISLTLLKEDLAYGLELLSELLEHAVFDTAAIEKVRAHILSDIDHFWDEPSYFVQQIAREYVYRGHPYAQNYLGTTSSIAHITRDDLVDYYKKYVTPVHARMAIVGNCGNHIEQICQEKLGKWSHKGKFEIVYPALVPSVAQEVVHPIVRDQAVFALAGLSVDRRSLSYDALLLFDQIFTGGAQHTMSSHLFQLREQTGLFYSIGGSLVFGADEQPGMFYIKTVVSHDRLSEAETSIKRAILEAPAKIMEEDLCMAKNALIHQLVDQCATQKSIAQALLFIKRMQLTKDYFSNRIERIKNIDKTQLINAASAVMKLDNTHTFKIGRLSS